MSVHFDQLLTPVKHKVGAAGARRLAELGIETVGDALNYAPRRYYHWGKLTSLSSLVEGEDVTVLAQVVSASLVHNRSGNGVRLVVVITDGETRLSCTFFAKKHYALSRHQKLLQPGETFLFAGKVSMYQGQAQLVQPQFEEVEADSDADVARKSGLPIPIYPTKGSLPSWKVKALIESIISTVNWDDVPEIIPESVRNAHGLLSAGQALQMLHAPNDDVDWQRAQRTLAWQEALVLQTALLLPRFGEEDSSVALGDAHGMVDQVRQALPFSLTNGQNQAWQVIAADLDRSIPMQRLLQADVGAGKTVVALLAMTRAVENAAQAALLAPTEVLAQQHFRSLLAMIERAGVSIPLHLLTSSVSKTTRNEIQARLAAGEAGIVVGTHALLQEGVEIPRLGLLVVDEQHRFGVAQREKLREGRDCVPHLLVMTATPIPRTIAMTVFGDLDITTMTELPPGRLPVATFLVDESNDVWMQRLWQRAREEVEAGGRVYVVCPRIHDTEDSDLPSIETMAQQLSSASQLQGIRYGIAHGELRPEESARALADFASGETPILLATTVVEVGVDVPEASMMVIMGAGQFGLSQLHQLRGRVGRSDRPSVCMLVHGPDPSGQTRQRLRAMEEFSDGFALAETDLQLRSEGDVLGKRQSGHSSSLRFLSVRRDGSIIAAAREAVASILDSDPQLEQHPGLRQAVTQRSGEQLVWLERN